MVLACEGVTSGTDTPVALVVLNKPDSILVGDTAVIQVRALNRSGDTIPNAVIVLFSRNPDTLGVDSARMAVIGLQKGTGRAVAVSGGLPSETFLIPVK